ncbi:TPM domain-containing protein [Halpernia frigidisoli]|uniref:TLP18.3, Psb32 and MOLO-1 founding protein of phosphatase n=1 Tax=Halpernia frigidisoli TaxID=1125876 RepID=A0A1I3DI69_9FLAO|nr:TPM domain-containing protein [Halpernia frigidisoli]SFH86437.1 TLP18.3, Psb32 and MOLO-1 founding protein of phosphatase [Halpernia frigidisoli]
MEFLSNNDLASLVEAIQTAENNSTGEIRVHVDSTTETQNAKIAFEIFKSLNMEHTAQRNAVLFHINFEQKYLTIIGDTGIHEVVKQSFWDKIHDEATKEFAQQNFCDGLKNAILKTGIELKKYFPVTGKNENELSDEITFS